MGKINYYGEVLEYNDEWSGKILPNFPLPKFPNDITVYGSAFYWETPNSEPFPKNMKGVKFVDCKLQNVIIPQGNTTVNCRTEKFAYQNDNNYWFLDDEGNPTDIIGHEVFTKQGLEKPKPEDIPIEKTEKPIDWVKVKVELSANITPE